MLSPTLPRVPKSGLKVCINADCLCIIHTEPQNSRKFSKKVLTKLKWCGRIILVAKTAVNKIWQSVGRAVWHRVEWGQTKVWTSDKTGDGISVITDVGVTGSTLKIEQYA